MLLILGLIGCTSGSGCDDTGAGEDRVKIVDWHVNDAAAGVELHAVDLHDGDGFAVGAHGAVVHGTEGGETWQPVDTIATDDLNGVWRGDGNAAFIVGDGGFVLKHAGSGDAPTFEPVELGTTRDLWAVAIDGEDGVILGDNALFRTDDGGSSWHDESLEGARLRTAAIAATADVWAVGDFGLIEHFDGDGWGLVDVGTTDDLVAVAFYDADHGLIGSESALWATTDGGETWLPATPTGEGLTGLIAANGDDYVASGDGGTVFRSEDGATTWLDIEASGIAGLTGISGFEDNSMPGTQLAAVGPGGEVLIYGSRFEDQPVTGDWSCP
jgi:photosystem II stability/assembly factor-like uncharacterized protein